MTYTYVQAACDYGLRKGPTLALVFHMAEGGGTVSYLDNIGSPPRLGVSANFVCEYSGRMVQMLPLDHASGSLHPGDIASEKPYYKGSIFKAVLGDWWDDPNSASISVEIEGFASSGPGSGQVKALIAWAADMAARFPTIRGAVGHADQTDVKACPGASSNMRAIFDGIGGHGLWAGGDMAGLAIRLAATASTSTPWTSFGTAKVVGTGKAGKRTSDGSHVALPDGLDLGCVQKGTLVTAHETWVAGSPVLVTNVNGYETAVYAADATFSPIAPPTTDCTAAIAAAVAKQKAADAALPISVTLTLPGHASQTVTF